MNIIPAIQKLNSHPATRHLQKKFHSEKVIKEKIGQSCPEALGEEGSSLEDLSQKITSAELKRDGRDKPYLYFGSIGGKEWTANLQEVGETGKYKYVSAYQGQPYSAWNQ